MRFGEIVDLKKLYDTQPQVAAMDLGEFARYMNQYDQKGRDFSLGTNPNFIKHTSSFVDDLFEATKIPAATGALTQAAAEMVGLDPKFGNDVGRDLPRGAVEVLSQAGWFFGPPGWAVAAAGLASAGSKGYTETDSVWAGAVDVAATAATPFVGMAGRTLGTNIAAKRIGGTLIKEGDKALRIAGPSTIGTRFGQAAVTRGTEEVAQLGLDAVSQALKGQNPFTPEALFANLISSTVDVVASGPAVKRLIDGKPTAARPFSTHAEQIQTQNVLQILDKQRRKFDEAVIEVDNTQAEQAGQRAARLRRTRQTERQERTRTTPTVVDRKQIQRVIDNLATAEPARSAPDVVAETKIVNQFVDELNARSDVPDFDAETRKALNLNPNGKFTSEGVLEFVQKMQRVHDEPVEKSLARLSDHLKDIESAASRRAAAERKAVDTQKKGKRNVDQLVEDPERIAEFNRIVQSLDDTQRDAIADAYARLGGILDTRAQTFALSAMQTAVLNWEKGGRKGDLGQKLKTATNDQAALRSAQKDRQRKKLVDQDVTKEEGVRTAEVETTGRELDEDRREAFVQRGREDGEMDVTDWSDKDAQRHADRLDAKYGVGAGKAYLFGLGEVRGSVRTDAGSAESTGQKAPSGPRPGQPLLAPTPPSGQKLSPRERMLWDWNKYAARAFEGSGLDTDIQLLYMDLGQRILLSFDEIDIPRIAALRQREEVVAAMGSVLGLNVPRGANDALMPKGRTLTRILGLTAEKVSDNKIMDGFIRVATLAHEQFHGMYNYLSRYRGNKKDILEKRTLLNRMEERAESLTVDERNDTLRFMYEYMIPKKLRNDTDINPVLREAAEDVEEFLAVFTETFSIALTMDKNARSKIQELKGHLAPEEVEFLQNQFRDLEQISRALSAFGKQSGVGERRMGQPEVNLGEFVEDFKALARTPEVLRKAQERLIKMNRFLDPQANVGRFHDQDELIRNVEDFFGDEDIKAKVSKSEQSLIKTALQKVFASDFRKFSETDQGIKPSFMTQAFGNPIQFALSVGDRIPIVRDLVANVYDKRSRADAILTDQNRVFMSRNLFGQLTSIANIPDKRLTPKQRLLKTAMGLVAQNPQAERAFSDIALRHNSERQNYTSPEDVMDIPSFARLESAERAQVWRLIEATKSMNTRAAQNIVQYSARQTGTMIAKFLMLQDPELRSADAQRQGMELQRKATELVARLNPQVQALLHGQVMRYTQDGVTKYVPLPQSKAEQIALRNQLVGDPTIDGRSVKAFQGSGLYRNKDLNNLHLRAVDQFANLLKSEGFDASIAQTVAATNAAHQVLTKVMDRPYFFTERRVGDYIVKYRRGEDENATIARRTEREANEAIAKLKKDPDVDPTSFVTSRKSQREKNSVAHYLNPTALRVFVELEKTAYEAAKAKHGKENADALFPDYTPGEASLQKALKERTRAFLRLQEQKPGREFTNLWESAIDYSTAVAYSLANSETRNNAELMLREPEFRDHPHVKKLMDEWVKNETDSAHKEYPGLKSGIFTYFLGFNLSSALIESSQTFLTTMPQITRLTGSFRESGAIIGRASRTVAQAYNARGFMTPGKLKFDDPELQIAFSRAIDEAVVSYGALDDVLLSPMELDTINSRRLTKGLLPVTAKEAVKNTAHLYAKTARSIYSVTTGTNARIAFVAGFEIGKKQGLQGDALYAFATEFTRSTQFSGGKPNRPFGLRYLGNAQGAASVLLSLSNFMMSSLHMMARLFNDSLREAKTQGVFSNLSEAGGARKAFMQMMGTQAFFAGAMGMPLAGFMVKTLEEIFGKEIYAATREGITQLMGDDEELGGLVSDIAMNGVPSAFLGVDVGSRFSLGSMFGLTAYQGFSMGGFLGAGGSIVNNVYEGLSMATQGDVGGAFQKALPQAFKNPLELMRNNGQFMDQKGELLYEPNFGEKLAYSIGLRPKQLADMRLQQRLMRTANDVATKDRREQLGEMADKLLADDVDTARQMVEAYASQTPYTADEVMRSVVDMALERMFPRDFLDEGTKASAGRREQIAGSFNTRLPRFSELKEEVTKKALRSKLSGAPEELSPVEMIRANLIDDYISQNPNVPRTVARQAVSERMKLMGL